MKTEQEAEIVPETPETTALAVRETQAVAPVGLFGATSPVEVIAKATEVATALKDVLKKQRLISTISGREYPKCEAWTLLGTMLGLFPVLSWCRPMENGWEARVEVHTKQGQVIGAAEAQCLRAEKNWSNRDDFALRSMAQTRATAKALRMPLGFVMTLAGYESTPAEEMGHEPATVAPVPPAPKPTPTPAAPAKTPAERLAGLKAALGRNEGWAVGYLREHKLDGKDGAELMPNEGLDGLSAEKVGWLADHWHDFQNRLSQYIAENDDSGDYAPVKSTEAPFATLVPEALKQAEQIASGEFNPPWKETLVPFGRDKGKKFGDLEAKTLWWWFMVWGGKPLEPREYNGKMYEPRESDQQLWQLLNSHKQQAIEHYHFKEPKE